MTQQREDVAADEWLAARDVESLEPELYRPVDDAYEPLEGQPRLLSRPRRNQAVGARQVAGVVDLQPQLTQPVRSDHSPAAGIRLASERLVGEHAHAIEGPQEIVDVQPSFPGFDLPSCRIPRDEAPERHRTRCPGDCVEQLATCRLDDDPVRCGGVHAVGEPVVLEQV